MRCHHSQPGILVAHSSAWQGDRQCSGVAAVCQELCVRRQHASISRCHLTKEDQLLLITHAAARLLYGTSTSFGQTPACTCSRTVYSTRPQYTLRAPWLLAVPATPKKARRACQQATSMGMRRRLYSGAASSSNTCRVSTTCEPLPSGPPSGSLSATRCALDSFTCLHACPPHQLACTRKATQRDWPGHSTDACCARQMTPPYPKHT